MTVQQLTDGDGDGAVMGRSDDKLAFYGGTAIVKPAATDSPETVLTNLGLKPTGSAYSITSTSPTAGIGYATGAGGAVTQITSRSTGVTLNTICGTITTDTTSLAAGGGAVFIVTNSTVALTDHVGVTVQSGLTTTQTTVEASTVTAGTFSIVVNNFHASTAEVGAIIINFAITKSVAA